MAYKNYKIRDNWLDIDKYNDVDIQSVDGVIQTIKVNGQDAGGGGSSDFSTAEVTVINNSSSKLKAPNFVWHDDEQLFPGFDIDPQSEVTLEGVLYKGEQVIDTLFKGSTVIVDGTGIAVTGDIENRSDESEVYIVITGNGTITIS